jgi:hypothetical protein
MTDTDVPDNITRQRLAVGHQRGRAVDHWSLTGLAGAGRYCPPATTCSNSSPPSCSRTRRHSPKPSPSASKNNTAPAASESRSAGSSPGRRATQSSGTTVEPADSPPSPASTPRPGLGCVESTVRAVSVAAGWLVRVRGGSWPAGHARPGRRMATCTWTGTSDLLLVLEFRPPGPFHIGLRQFAAFESVCVPNRESAPADRSV